MDLEGVSIKPAEGMLAVKFVDDDEDDDGPSSSPSEPMDYEGCLAIVVAVGPKVTGAKRGDTIVCKPYARDGLKVGDDLVLIESWSVAATITE